jgi:hypothetical protein
MKSQRTFRKAPAQWCWVLLCCIIASAGNLAAADTNAPPALTPEQMFEGGTNSFNNWIDFSAGQAFVSGNRAQFQQQHQEPSGPFGGISDFHYQTGVASNTTLTLDGAGLVDYHDYKLSLGLQREKVGFLRFSYDQSRTWSDGGGGYFPASGQYYSSPNDSLALDRGKLTLQGGWTPETGPKVTFQYTHSFRNGDEGSTEWGYAHPTGSVLARGLTPSIDVLHEFSDSFQVDATDHIKATDLGLGLRYESGRLNDSLLISQFPGEPAQQNVTDTQNTRYDLFNAHTSTETWFKTNVLFSTGFSYSGVDNNFSGRRIYGNDFDVGYAPNAASGFGYYGLSESSQLHEYVFDFNLLYKPGPHFAFVPSIRVDREDWTASSAGSETLAADAPVPFTSDSNRGLTEVRERLDFNYNGLTNWAFYTRGDFTEGDGNLNQNGGLVPVGGIGILPIQEQTDDHRFFQKHSAGVRWYPSRRVTLDFGGYYKLNHYRYDNSLDTAAINSGELYPGYLAMQDFETYDGNMRLTWRPWRNVTSISRYEYQYSTIDTEPDPSAGLPDIQSSRMTSHIIAEDVSWVPWSRLSLQSGVNYVLSDTRTPASDVVEGVLNAQNNYWTVHFTSSLVVDDKNDLSVSYVYYISGDYNNNSPLGVPYGAGSKEHAVTATWTRRISKNMRFSVKYGYFRYSDATYGGNRDFGANLIYASLLYRF